jgi:methyl-accepting chemotaxis protein
MAHQTGGAWLRSLRWKIAALAAGTALVTVLLEGLFVAVLGSEREGATRTMAFAAAAIAAAGAVAVARLVARPVEKLRTAVAAAAAGDLGAAIPVEGSSEVADLGASVGGILESLHGTVAALREASEKIERGTSEIQGSAARQAAMVAQQAAAINETSTTASEIAQTSKQATDHANSVIEMTKRSEDLSHEGLSTVEEAVKASASLGDQVNRIAAMMAGLTERTVQVGEIISTVKDLADQSDLLALNASIEASKGGEHGRGFAVVAMEMRNLAEQSRQAAVQIRAILQEIQRGTRDAAEATDEGAKRANGAMALARSAGEAIEGLATVIKDSSVAARQIANNTRQQTIGVDQIVNAIRELSQAMADSQEGTRSIEQRSAALAEVSRKLGEAVSRYRS